MRKIKNSMRIIILLIGMLFVLSNCEKEELSIINEKIETLDIKEAHLYMSDLELEQQKSSDNKYIIFKDLEHIYQEAIINSSKKMTIVPIKTIYETHFSRILLLKVKGEIKSVVVSMVHKDENSDTKERFTGAILVNTLKGDFIKGYNVDKGKIISLLNPRTDINSKTDKQNEVGCLRHAQPDPLCYYCIVNKLNLVTIIGKIKDTDQGIAPINEGGSDPIPIPWDPGDGYPPGNTGPSYNNDCPLGKVKNLANECVCPEGKKEDSSGNCIDKTPCDYINAQVNDINIIEKIAILKDSTGIKYETGYVQNKDGSFTKLESKGNGHQLDFSNINESMVNGFLHTHLDDFLTGEIDKKTGLPIINKNIRIFSPADVIKFLQIAKRSEDTSLVYAFVITSTGNYSLRFNGNKNDIVNIKEAKNYLEDYKRELRKGKEKGFLRFLKNHIKVNGIELYKTNDNGTIKKKYLNEEGKLESEPC